MSDKSQSIFFYFHCLYDCNRWDKTTIFDFIHTLSLILLLYILKLVILYKSRCTGDNNCQGPCKNITFKI